MRGLNIIIRYWKVGKLLHIVAILAFSIAVNSFSILIDLSFHTGTFLWLMYFIIFFNMGVLAELDGYSRYQNYKHVKDQMFLNGYQERQLKPLLKSSCQREAAILAGDELGFGEEVRTYFNNLGYRWYHIIPDFVFQNPLIFFTPLFWRTTFFAPYYKPKVNYERLVYLKSKQLF